MAKPTDSFRIQLPRSRNERVKVATKCHQMAYGGFEGLSARNDKTGRDCAGFGCAFYSSVDSRS